MAKRTISVHVNVADLPLVKAAVLAAYDAGWSQGYGEGRDDEAAGLPLRTAPSAAPPDSGGR